MFVLIVRMVSVSFKNALLAMSEIQFVVFEARLAYGARIIRVLFEMEKVVGFPFEHFVAEVARKADVGVSLLVVVQLTLGFVPFAAVVAHEAPIIRMGYPVTYQVPLVRKGSTAPDDLALEWPVVRVYPHVPFQFAGRSESLQAAFALKRIGVDFLVRSQIASQWKRLIANLAAKRLDVCVRRHVRLQTQLPHETLIAL